MDNVTHTLAGLMLARACGLDARLPRAALLLMAAANIPDIDIVAGLAGAPAYLDQHRSITHSLFFAPWMAVLPVLLVRWLDRGALAFPWVRAWLFSLIGVLSHLVFDWTNVYGIRLFAPVSEKWFRLDIAQVIDPWILFVLLLACGAPLLSRLVGSEMGGRKRRGPERGWAIFVLLVIAFYCGGRFVAHERAMAQLSARIYEGSQPDRVTALPHAVNPLRWTGLVEQRASVTIVPVDLLTEFDPTAGQIYFRAGEESAGAIAAAKRNASYQALARFSQIPFWKVTPLSDPENAVQVTLMDLRFGTPVEPGFAATGVVLPGGSSVQEIRLSLGSVGKAFR